ncbi:VanZ family protein [Methylomonas sp. MgM2]
MPNRIARWLDPLTLIAYCGWIFWLSAQETLPVPEVFSFQDKALHFGAYFAMAILSWRAFSHFGIGDRHLAVISCVFCSIYGASDEWHQSFVYGRTASVEDWLADSLGAIFATFLLLKYRKPA